MVWGRVYNLAQDAVTAADREFRLQANPAQTYMHNRSGADQYGAL